MARPLGNPLKKRVQLSTTVKSETFEALKDASRETGSLGATIDLWWFLVKLEKGDKK